MPPFPLTPFLLNIESEIRVTLRDRVRIATALNAGGPWTLARLRSTLTTILGRSPLQQDLIRRRFDQFFRQSFRTEVSPDGLTVDLDAARADFRRWAWMSTAGPIGFQVFFEPPFQALRIPANFRFLDLLILVKG